MFTSTTASGFKIFVGKYKSFYADDLEDHETVSTDARVPSDGILYWNIAAILIIGFSIKVRCP